MHEYVINLHMHTRYSDGHGSHQDIVNAAAQAGIDVVIVTDHNVLVKGIDGYYGDTGAEDEKAVLMLVGQEVHDQTRHLQKNHLLIIGAGRELATYADTTQQLIRSASEAGGLTFLAHPVDNSSSTLEEDDLSWVDWDVHGFDGIELWNGMTELKPLIKSKFHALFYAYLPKQIANGPFPETIRKWDELLAGGRKVVALGGSDAHAWPAKMGPLKRIVFPYEFHFKSINTHIWTSDPFDRNPERDINLVLEALRLGHAFIGYDLPASTRGFRFTAHYGDGVAWMGDEVSVDKGVTLQIRLPQVSEMCLIKDGKLLKSMTNRNTYSYHAKEPGVYRVEVYIRYRGKRRVWIFSNPIYVR